MNLCEVFINSICEKSEMTKIFLIFFSLSVILIHFESVVNRLSKTVLVFEHVQTYSKYFDFLQCGYTQKFPWH